MAAVNFQKNTQLCWNCKRAYGTCCWTDGRALPVPGWVAKPTMLDMHGVKARPSASFDISYCPQFVEDERIEV